jgi:hypothetical protein
MRGKSSRLIVAPIIKPFADADEAGMEMVTRALDAAGCNSILIMPLWAAARLVPLGIKHMPIVPVMQETSPAGEVHAVCLAYLTAMVGMTIVKIMLRWVQRVL